MGEVQKNSSTHSTFSDLVDNPPKEFDKILNESETIGVNSGEENVGTRNVLICDEPVGQYSRLLDLNCVTGFSAAVILRYCIFSSNDFHCNFFRCPRFQSLSGQIIYTRVFLEFPQSLRVNAACYLKNRPFPIHIYITVVNS